MIWEDRCPIFDVGNVNLVVIHALGHIVVPLVNKGKFFVEAFILLYQLCFDCCDTRIGGMLQLVVLGVNRGEFSVGIFLVLPNRLLDRCDLSCVGLHNAFEGVLLI